jgi:hypothetical protein
MGNAKMYADTKINDYIYMDKSKRVGANSWILLSQVSFFAAAT